MKIKTVDDAIEEFRNGRNIWSRQTIELFVREISRLHKKLLDAYEDADALAEELTLEQNPGYRCYQLKKHDERLQKRR
ncbi:MAG: hypothetical protein CVU46_09570 [Chloroflexi bacterium HGW-Chloroflexi-8]|jgi:hypothetical protein|nr:MAG: hypothetical protein CVU46_09570 [Chloroflexi bacterium HGW-Chloroflexi-8]